MEHDPNASFRMAFSGINRLIGYIANNRPEITSEFVSVLKKRFTHATKDVDIDVTLFDFEELSNELEHLKADPELQELILLFICKQLGLPSDFKPGSGKVQVTNLNYFKSFRRHPYHCIKACADVLGDKKGIQLWKAYVAQRIEDIRITEKKERQEKLERGEKDPQDDITLTEHREQRIKAWSDSRMSDFKAAILDENRHLYRFDNCLTHEALKDLDDPDFAYLCSCYPADTEEFNIGRTIQMRRTQTLHHAKFCDEFYWDSRAFTEPPEQPPLELTENL
jgi:hypothetical protein